MSECDHPSSDWARGWGLTIKRRLFIVRAHPLAHSDGGCHPSLKGYPPSSQGFLSPPWARTWDHELRYPFEVVPTTNWATSSVGSESAPHFNMSLWSWVRALTEAKEKGMGHALIACEWDHPSSEWARGWGLTTKRHLFL